MKAERVHPPDFVIDRVGEPAQRLVRAHMVGGNHPADLFPAKSAEIRIVDEVVYIVPGQEAVFQCRQEGKERSDGNQERQSDVYPGRSNKWRGAVSGWIR